MSGQLARRARLQGSLVGLVIAMLASASPAATLGQPGASAAPAPAASEAPPSTCVPGEGHRLYFAADDGIHGTELWVTDGTGEGTRMVADIDPDGSSDPQLIGTMDGVLYLFADDGVHGREPWRSDGTAQGTWLLADLVESRKGSAPPRPQPSVVEGDQLQFLARTSKRDLVRWSTDGTTEGTRLMPAGASAPSPHDSLPVYVDPISEREQVVSARGYAVERTSGTGWRTWSGEGLPDIDVFTYEDEFSVPGLMPVTILGDRLLFYADTGDGFSLWASDGTEAGTRQIAAIGPQGSRGWYEVPEPLAILKDRAILLAEDERGPALWVTDGTEAGTRRSAGLRWLGREHMSWVVPAVSDGRAYLEARNDRTGRQVWVTDGTASGTRRLTDLPPGSRPVDLAAADGRVLIGIMTADRTPQLWTSDGTRRGTHLLRSFPADPPFWTTPVFLKGTPKGALVVHPLKARIPGPRREPAIDAFGLSVTDGTLRGTRRIEGVTLRLPRGGGPEEQAWQIGAMRDAFAPMVMDGHLFFRNPSTDAPEPFAGLWRSDGTAAGTERLSPIVPSSFLAPITPGEACPMESPG